MTVSLLRERGRHDSGKVGMVELFFDLVFVFAVTQLSHTLLANLTWRGAAEVALMLLAVWWVWIYTCWVTNWLDPERIPVRLCLFALMLAGLTMSVSIPKAFGERGLMFAAAYVSMQVGRTLFFLWAVRGEVILTENFQRILVWFSASGALWIAGAFAGGDARLGWWALALVIECAAPWLFFWVPGLGRSRIGDWNVEGSHLSERCALFVIIALGESLLVTGATFAAGPSNAQTWSAFVVAAVNAIAMWWLYFDTGAERAHERIVHADDPGRQARAAYTYLHLPIVAGIIVAAVGDEVVLAHPDHATGAGIAVILGAPICYLVGTGWFKWVTNDRKAPPLSHLAGLAFLAALFWPALAHLMSALQLSAATTAALVLVAIWESVSLRTGAVTPATPSG